MHLKNDNLVLRYATVDDVKVLCDWWSDGKVMAHAGFPNGIYTDADKLAERIKDENSSSRILIIEIDCNKVGEMNYEVQNNIATIGIKICDFAYQGKGYGTKALSMLIEFLFKDMKAEKVVLDTNLNNKRAQHVYEKIGFRKIAIRNNCWRDELGILQSAVDYELEKEEFFK
ncbi:GNAT family N-acetyltransferase [Clostridium sp. YIM B02505]|uniref:GNAT family N-acetyltransferase n=1 Tax=Clostridium yunnanense TaxID=2800325 RepID=A0ABS1EKS1_9CLOT|nr:GNAT family protein [Clostridium yunnanense]MBK1809960.1 GNAT family N-acetyltransferase [Clostridium yunnanense]